MSLDKAVRDIKSLKIQGAEGVAKHAVSALYHVLHHSKARNAAELVHELRMAKSKLIHARATEPCLRNALNYVVSGINITDLVKTVHEMDLRIKHVQNYFEDAERKIAEYGEKKIHDRNVVFTHCHSSTVMMIFAKARFRHKKFEVHNCETRPLFQGRKTAKELSALGVKVHHYIDSAARFALKKCDLFLFGADAIQSDGRIINKIGTELMLEIADKYQIPSFCCSVSWKFDPATVLGMDEPIENRKKEEVWKNSPKKVIVMNPAFEIVDPDLVTGIISELGVYKPEVFVDEVRRTSPWMF